MKASGLRQRVSQGLFMTARYWLARGSIYGLHRAQGCYSVSEWFQQGLEKGSKRALQRVHTFEDLCRVAVLGFTLATGPKPFATDFGLRVRELQSSRYGYHRNVFSHFLYCRCLNK